VRLLGLLGLGLVLGALDVLAAVALGDQGGDVVLGGLGEGRGVGAYIGDEPDRAFPWQLDPLVQLLGCEDLGPAAGPAANGGLLVHASVPYLRFVYGLP
jgi:hypothetical protein